MRKIAAFLYRHRRDRNIWVIALCVHLVFILTWRLTDDRFHFEFYRNAITTAMVSSVVFYTIIIVAFWKAQKTRLNKALALNKTFWDLLILGFGLPAQTGWWSPASQGVRAYIWSGITLSISWVLYEFVMVNWKRRAGYPWVERRIIVRREIDRQMLDELAWYRANCGPAFTKG